MCSTYIFQRVNLCIYGCKAIVNHDIILQFFKIRVLEHRGPIHQRK